MVNKTASTRSYSPPYFSSSIENIYRMAKPDFLPTDQDILHIYIPTKGIYEYTNETNFLIEEIPFNIIGKFKMSYITSSF